MGERTDGDVLSGKPVTVTLGEREFEITPRLHSQSRKFRTGYKREVQAGEIIAGDELVDLIYEYSPELAAAREYIEENATDSQLVEALAVITGLAFGPFVKEFPAQMRKIMGGWMPETP